MKRSAILTSFSLSLFALVNLVTWLVDSETSFTWAVFHFALGKSKSVIFCPNFTTHLRHPNSLRQLYACVVSVPL
jgi:hypothetical protein